MAGLLDWFPGIRPSTPYSDRWRSFLGDLQQQGVTVDPTQSGGYANRNIRGTNTPSLHASDRAYDVNWRSNPEGTRQNEADIARQHLERDMGGSTAPITQIHPMIARETAARHGMRWGGDFRNRSPDPMHFEVAGPMPGGIQNRSLVAHAGLTPPTTPPTGATNVTPQAGGLLQGIMQSIMGSAQAQGPMTPPAAPQAAGFNPEMLQQIVQALQPPPQAPAQPGRGASFTAGAQPAPPRTYPSGADPVATPMAMPNPETDFMMPPQGGAPTPPPAPMGVPQMGGPPQMPGAQPPTPSAMDTNWQPPQEPQTIEAPLPITPPDPEAIMQGAQQAHTANNPPQPQDNSILGRLGMGGAGSYLTALIQNPAFIAGLSTLGGGNPGQSLMAAQQGNRQQQEHDRTQRQRSVMDRTWAEAFPNGQPNMQHPLLTGQTPQVAAMIASMGPEQALPLLARSAMERRQLELKDIGGQGVVFDPRTGRVENVPGTGPKAPEAIRTNALKVNAAHNSLNTALDDYERLVRREGITAMPGQARDAVQQARTNIQLQLKELYNLGVLNGPDLHLMEQMLTDTSLSPSNMLANPAGRVSASVARLKSMLKTVRDNAVAAAGGQAPEAAAQQPAANDPLGIR